MNEPDDTRPKRRGFRWRNLLQFNLKTLVGLLLLTALLMGAARWRLQQYQRRHQLTQALVRKANHVATIPGTPAILAPIADAETFQDIYHLSLHNRRDVTDSDLALLEFLPELRRLSLHGARITEDGAVHLRKLERLNALSLKSTGVTDKTVESLAGLTDLRLLQLSNCPKAGSSLAKLHRLTRLEVFEARYAQATDEHLGWLARCEYMRELDIAGTLVADPSDILAPMKRLTKLCVGGKRLKRFELREVGGLKSIQVEGRDADVTIETMPKLAQISLNRVRRLRLRDLAALGALGISRADSVEIVDVPRLTQLTCARVQELRIANAPQLVSLRWGGAAEVVPDWMADLETLQQLQLTFRGGEPIRIESLSKLNSLKQLTLIQGEIDAETLASLPGSLETLNLVSVRCDSDSLAALRHKPNLVRFSAVASRMHPAALAGLAGADSLRELQLEGVTFGEGKAAPTRPSRPKRATTPIEPIAALPNLRSVEIGGYGVELRSAAEFLGDWSTRTRLAQLQLRNVRLEDQDVTALAAAPKLVRLRIYNNSDPWSLERCRTLAGSATLKQFLLSYAGVPQSGAVFQNAMRQLNPQLSTYFQPKSPPRRMRGQWPSGLEQIPRVNTNITPQDLRALGRGASQR